MSPDDATHGMSPQPPPGDQPRWDVTVPNTPVRAPLNTRPAASRYAPPRPSAPPRAGAPTGGSNWQQASHRGPRWLWALVGLMLGALIATFIMVAALRVSPLPLVPAPQTAAPLQVTIRDAFLTQSLAATSGANGLSFAQPAAHIGANGQITITGVLSGASSLSGTQTVVVIQPYVANQTLHAKVLGASVGGFPVPVSFLGPVQSQIDQQLGSYNSFSLGGGSRAVVSAVTFTNGAMTISYTTQPS